MPYGDKTPEQLLELTTAAFDFFSEQGVKAVVMACNTTSATVYDKIKNIYPFKIYPIIQSVAECLPEVNTLGVFATQATVNSHAYSKSIQGKVIEIACPEWVKLVENGQASLDQEKSCRDVEEKLKEMLSHKPDKIILGCTHYPYLLPVLTKFAPAELFIDPGVYFAEFIANDIERNSNGTGSEEFYVSGSPENFIRAAKMFYEIKTAKSRFN
jgi:glutamate racemase